MRPLRRLFAAALVAALVAAACWGGDAGTRTHTARFARAVQVFPGIAVRVLGVDVGRVLEVRNEPDGVLVAFEVTDPSVRLAADVKAAVVPSSLLGERYIQLFPAYTGGPTLGDGAEIPLERTAVPSEPDELLRALQDDLGRLDPATVGRFVSTAARALDGNGAELSRLIEHGASVMETLSAKRDDLAVLIVELDKLTQALAGRQEALGRVIRTYGRVVGTVVENRDALEGTIQGLNLAATELASLLVDHRAPLGQDIRALTRTGRTIDRNVDRLARTGHHARRLFLAASRAADYDRDWLRLGNQGQELAVLILFRIEQRLIDLCVTFGADECAVPAFWEQEVPELFCFDLSCAPSLPRPPEEALAEAVAGVPGISAPLTERAIEETCADAERPKACERRERRKQAAGVPSRGVEVTMESLLEETLGDPLIRYGGLL
ncbi:MAG: MCE family protein [Actinobacteria bacterium]|nr:MCE family protein [Actinomycetota bacterium]